MFYEFSPSEIFLLKAMILNHGPHTAIKYHNTLLQGGLNLSANI
jgi:hypothetical protein